MDKYLREELKEHIRNIFGESCKININTMTIRNIEYIRIGEVFIVTPNIYYNKEDNEFYYSFNKGKNKIRLNNQKVVRVYLKEFKEYMYGAIFNENCFSTKYRDEYKRIYEIAAYENSQNYVMRLKDESNIVI